MFLLVQRNHYLMGIIDRFCDLGSIISFLSEEKDKLDVEEVELRKERADPWITVKLKAKPVNRETRLIKEQ